MASRAIYRIKGSYWRQDSLLYGEWLECVALLKGRMSQVREGGLAGVASLLDEMSRDGTLQKLLSIVVKPHEPTRLHRWRNGRALKKHGVTRENFVLHMEAGEVARAGIDFFRVNLNWISKSLTSPIGLSFMYRKLRMNPMEMLLASLKIYGTYQMATSPKRNGSGKPMPQKSSASR
jgi:hypothetical protein